MSNHITEYNTKSFSISLNEVDIDYIIPKNGVILKRIIPNILDVFYKIELIRNDIVLFTEEYTDEIALDADIAAYSAIIFS